MKKGSVFSSSKWSSKKGKLAVCIPTRDTLHSAHAMSLVELVKFNTMNDIDTHVFMDASTILLTQRERLASMALELDAEYILWLDSDIVFPATTAVRLLAHNEPVVAANLAVVIVPSVISIAAIAPSAIEAPIICETAICYLFFL